VSGVSGDFSRLQVLLQRVSEARLADVKRALVANLAEEALTQIKLGFEQGRAPDGSAWKPLQRKRSRDKKGSKGTPLNDTGRLKNSWTRIVRADGFTWQNATVYAAAHNYGADIDHSARGNFHSKRGRFISTAKAMSLKRTPKTSFSKASTQHLPARPMVPAGDLPPRWRNAFDAVIKKTLVGYGMGN
jgi:phage virion morphogenesis protein